MTEERLSIKEVAAILGGEWVVPPTDENVLIQNYAIYSGEVVKEPQANLFFAMDRETWLRGTHNTGVYAAQGSDSHDKVAQLAPYLQMAVVQRYLPEVTVPQLRVADSYEAMVKLFAVLRERYAGHSIGITGTVGKSTMRRLVSHLLGTTSTVHQTPNNHNSRTSARVAAMSNQQAEYNVLEIAVAALWYGPKKVGFADELPLDLTIITQVGIGQWGYDADKMADFKSRIAAGLHQGKPLLVNGDIENIGTVRQFAGRYTQDVVTYGLTANQDFQGTVSANALTVSHAGTVVAELDVTGLDSGMISNALGSIAAYVLLKGSIGSQVLNGFTEFCQSVMTRKIASVTAAGHKLTIVDDTHNAELLSMNNFIDYARKYPVNPNTRKIFVVGRIVNLEDSADQVYAKLFAKINQANFEAVYTFGPDIERILPQSPLKNWGGQYTDRDTLTRAITADLQQDTVVFVKGSSRNSSIDRIRDRLVGQADYYATGAMMPAFTGMTESDERYSPNGVGRLLVILSCLEQLAQGKVRLSSKIRVSNGLLRDKSVNKVGLQVGKEYMLVELLTVAIVAPAPDAIINLAESLFSGNHNAVQTLRQRAKELQLSTDALVNITGRPTRQPQRTRISDLDKIGAAFCQLPNEVYSLLAAQRTTFNGKLYQKRSQLQKTGKISGALFMGYHEACGLYFVNDSTGKRCISFINSPVASFNDAQAEWMLDTRANEKIIPAGIQTVELKNPEINLLADTYFGESYTRARQRRGKEDALQKYGYAYSFDKLGEFFKPAAFNILNFEAVFAQGESQLNGIKGFLLDAESKPTLAELRARHFKLAMLANNHAKDFGGEALTQTMLAFQQAGMLTSGAGDDLTSSRRIIEFTYQNQKYALFNGYWYRNPAYNLYDFYAKYRRAGVNCLDTFMPDDIRAYKRVNPEAKVIVSAHWGVDFKEILPAQRVTAQRLAAAGADLIIGHGPHTLQPIEYVGKTLVMYAIGNGVFNSNGEFNKHNALPYGATLRLNLAENQVYWCPFYANNLDTFWQPDFVSDDDFHEICSMNEPKFSRVKVDGRINALRLGF